MLAYLIEHFLNYLFIGIGGAIIGSLLTIIIYRLPLLLKKEWYEQCVAYLQLNVANFSPLPPLNQPLQLSCHCTHCQHPLKLSALIPVLSYFRLGRRCLYCAQPIAFRYPLIEILSGLLSVYLFIHFDWGWQFGFAFIFSCILICLLFIDLDHQLLPDNLTLTLLWLGLIANLWQLFCPLQDAVIGAAIGYSSLWLISYLFKLIRGREGIGHGDFKLLAALGAWLGWQMLPLIILFASLAGTLAGLYLVRYQAHQPQHPIAFGPYLAIAGWMVLCWGNTLAILLLPLWS